MTSIRNINKQQEDGQELYGVSLRFLSDFASKVPSDLSTAQIVAKYIAPKSHQAGGSEPFVSLVSHKYVGPAQHYVIHAWSCCFLADLVVPLLQHFIGDPNSDPAARANALSSTFVWIDCFSAPLPPAAAEVASAHGDVAAGASAGAPQRQRRAPDLSIRRALVDAAVRQCSTALLMLDSSAAALGRTWCQYEVAAVLALKGGPQSLHVPMFEFPLDIVYKTLRSINPATSRAHTDADRGGLLAALMDLFPGLADEGAGGPGSRSSSPAPLPASRSSSSSLAPSSPSRSPSGPLGTVARKIMGGIQESLVGEAQQLIRSGVRSGVRYLACLRKAAEALRLGRAPLAEALALASVKEHRKALGDSDAATLNSLSNLALLRKSQGNHGEAEQLLRQVLEGRRSLLGREHPDTAASCDHLAWVLTDMGQLGEAVQLYREALDVSRCTLGEDHPDTASSRTNLAGVLQSLGRLDEAEPLLLRSLEAAKRSRGEQHPYTATTYNNLGALYRAKGNIHAAKENFQAAYDISVAALGPAHADTLTACNNLSLALLAEGRPAEAEELLLRARESAEALHGPNHPPLRSLLAALGHVLEEQGHLAEAIAVLQLAGPEGAELLQRLSQQQQSQAEAVSAAAAATGSQAGAADAQQAEHQQQQQQSQAKGRRAPLDPETAALRIQAYHRGHIARVRVAKMRRTAAAGSVPRSGQPDGGSSEGSSEMEEAKAKAATRIQAYHRGRMARRHVVEMRQKRAAAARAAAMAAATEKGDGGKVGDDTRSQPAGPPAAALPPLQLTSPGVSPHPSAMPYTPPPPTPPPAPPTPLSTRRPMSRNVAIVQAREMFKRRSGSGGTGCRTSMTSACDTPPFTSPRPPGTAPGSTMGSPVPPMVSQQYGSGGIMTPYISLNDYFRAPEAALRAITAGALPPSDLTPRDTPRVSDPNGDSIPALLPSWVDANAAVAPRADDLVELHADMLGSALAQLRLTKARDNVIRTGAEARAILQLKLNYVRMAVEQALDICSETCIAEVPGPLLPPAAPSSFSSTAAAPHPLPQPVSRRNTFSGDPGDRSHRLRSPSSDGDPGDRSRAGSRMVSETGEPRQTHRSSSAGRERGAGAGGGAGGGGDVSARPLVLPVASAAEGLPRPVNRHGMPRQPPGGGRGDGVAGNVEPQPAQGGRRKGVREEDVDALMAELTDLRMLLLTTNSALSAAHRGLHKERATRQALSTELAELQRKLGAAIASGKLPASRPSSSRPPPTSGTALHPSLLPPGPYASVAVAAVGGDSTVGGAPLVGLSSIASRPESSRGIKSGSAPGQASGPMQRISSRLTSASRRASP